MSDTGPGDDSDQDTRDGETDESTDTWHRESFSSWDSDIEALRTARSEARASLDQTIDSIREVDETAMRTRRINLVILGLVLTAVTSVPATLRLGNPVTVLGFVSLLVSTGLALMTNVGSDYPTGVGRDHLTELQAASWTEREWNEWMVREYEVWLQDAREMESGDARALFYTQIGLGIAIGFLVAGIALGAADVLKPIAPFRNAGTRTVHVTGTVFYVAATSFR